MHKVRQPSDDLRLPEPPVDYCHGQLVELLGWSVDHEPVRLEEHERGEQPDALVPVSATR